MTRFEEKMRIQPGDHISQRVVVNGYPVTLRFAAEPSSEICVQIKSIFLSSIALDCSTEVCNDCAEKSKEQEEKQ